MGWTPATHDRVRLRHAWPDQGLARGDVGTVVNVEVGGAPTEDGGTGEHASGTVWVTWDRYPGDVRFCVAVQLDPDA